jgi:hypothetical protein
VGQVQHRTQSEHCGTLLVQYSALTGDRVPTSALASEPRAHEGAQRAYLRTPVSQVRCEGG